MASNVAGQARRRALLAGNLARTPDPGRLLETRIGVFQLCRDRVSDVVLGRLGRSVPRHTPASGGAPQGSASGDGGPLGPSVSARSDARTRRRLPAGSLALVGSLVEGNRPWRHAGGALQLLHDGERRTAPLLRRAFRTLGRRGSVAESARERADVRPQSRRAR